MVCPLGTSKAVHLLVMFSLLVLTIQIALFIQPPPVKSPQASSALVQSVMVT